MESNQTILVLSDKRKLPLRKFVPVILVTVAILPSALIVLAYSFIFPDLPWSLLLEKLAAVDWTHTFIKHPDVAFAFAIVIGQIWYFRRASRLERLTLTPDGIRYTSPLPLLMKRLNPDWTLSWSQIKRAELGALIKNRIYNQEGVLLTLESASGKRRIFPSRWVDPVNYSQPTSPFRLIHKLTRQPQDEIIKAVMASEIARYISRNAPHITIDSNLDRTESSNSLANSLERNPHGRISIVVIFLLIMYTVIDLMAGSESYITPPSSLAYIYISAGLLGTILSGIWLHKSTLANTEKGGLAILIGVVVSAAMLPGALRINALTDTNGLAAYDYHVTQSAGRIVLRPVADGMPVIDYFAPNQFWGRFGKDKTYPVQIRKGGLGFYQFNTSAILDDIHRH